MSRTRPQPARHTPSVVQRHQRPISPEAKASVAAPTGLLNRVIGILNADDATYAAVKDDPAATRQALLIVGATTLVGAISRRDDPLIWQLVGPIVGLLAWLLGTWLTYLIGTRLLEAPAPEEDDWIPLLRMLGWTQISSIGGLLHLVPTFGALLSGLASLWGLVLIIKAIKVALGVSAGRALATSMLVCIPEIALFMPLYFTFRSWGWA